MMRMKWLVNLIVVGAVVFLTAPVVQARMVTDAEGNSVTLLESAPKRIVALSEIDLDIALALGLTPAGTINGRGQKSHPHYLKNMPEAAQVAGIPIVGDLGRPALEAVIKLKPDLILTAPSRQETLMLLRKIAPTFVSHKNGDHWRDVLGRVAPVLQREDQAKAFLASYDQEVAAARAGLVPVIGKTVSIIRWNPTGPAFMQRDSFASLILKDLGFERPASQQEPGQKHSMPVSLESLQVIDADWMFVGTLEPSGDAADALRDMAANPAFARLGAVRAKHYFPVDGSKWTSVGGPLAALSIVREARALILGAK